MVLCKPAMTREVLTPQIMTKLDDDDLPEIRSRLVAHVAAGSGAGAAPAAASYVIDGSSADLTLGAGQNSATIYAVIYDDAFNVRSSQAGNYLVGEEVTFHMTSNPAGVETGDRTQYTREINSTVNSNTRVAIPLATRTTSSMPSTPPGMTT